MKLMLRKQQAMHDINPDDDEPPARNAGVELQRSAGVEPQEDGDESREAQSELKHKMDVQYSPRNEQYDMHQCKEARDYSHLFMETVNDEDER